MSYQEERLQEIADAIREVKGTTEKIPATNFASEIVGLSVVKPSGIITIKENGSHNVANYEWAEVNVEADLNERVIIGKWVCEVVGAGVTYTLEFKDDGKCVFGVSHSGGDSIIELVYSTLGNQIHLSIDGDSMVAEYYNDNDTILLDFDGEPAIFTRVQETANLITKEITENGTYKASDDGADGYSEVVVNVESGGGSDITFNRTFGENDWNTISAVANEIAYNNMTAEQVASQYGWNLGDTKSETLSTGEVIELQIVGYNHDDLSDGSGKAGMTLQMKNCLATKYPLTSTLTNAGGWGASKFRTTTLPTIKATLSQELKNNIKLVNKKAANGGLKNYSVTEILSDDLFLLSEYEMFGTAKNAQDGANEGTQYTYWQGKTDNDRIKKFDSNGDGVPETATLYWVRSAYRGDERYFCSIGSSGGAVFDEPNGSRGICFALCLGSANDIPVPGKPIKLSTDTEMTNALVEDNLGKVYKFTGTSETYETDAIYIVSEVE